MKTRVDPERLSVAMAQKRLGRVDGIPDLSF